MHAENHLRVFFNSKKGAVKGAVDTLKMAKKRNDTLYKIVKWKTL